MPLTTPPNHSRHRVHSRFLSNQSKQILWVFLLVVCLLSNYSMIFAPSSIIMDTSSIISSSTSSSSSPMRILVVAPTFYASQDDIRFEIALELCRQAVENQLELILVDASPSEEVRTRLQQAGKAPDGTQYVRVIKQTGPGKKGAALRIGIARAHKQIQQSTAITTTNTISNAMIAFQEPEKIGMMKHWKPVANAMLLQQADIAVPKRSDASFLQSYPIEQYHAEQFANLYLNSLAKQAGFTPCSIDWTMGPMAFRAQWANQWLEYSGEVWDAQIVPMVQAQTKKAAKIISYEFDYYQPQSMKRQEEGDPKWSEKRLLQLNVLFEIVGGALKGEK